MTDTASLSYTDILNDVRTQVRVLFISNDESLLRPQQQTLDGYVQLGSVFDEVHIVVLRTGASSPFPVLRVSHNTWLYTVSTDTWWWSPVVGLSLIEDQLVFNGEFRPDLIIARDPYESGVLAYWLSRRYGRAVQVHVQEDFTSKQFAEQTKDARYHRWMAKYVLNRVESVRTPSPQLRDMVKHTFSHLTDVSVLPRFNNYSILKDQPVIADLKEKYPQYRFTYLYVGEFTHECQLPTVLQALRGILQNHTVGLIVLGDGPAKKEFVAQCQTLGIERQVVFSNDRQALVSFMKTTNVLVAPDTTAEADEILFQAAAVGTPAVAVETQSRQHVFRHRDSILFVSPQASHEWQTHLSAVLNELSLRRELQDGVRAIISDTLHEDVEAYRTAYKQSIESAILTQATEDDTL